MNKDGVFSKISGALEGAFAVVLAQNALLMSKPILDISESKVITLLNIAVIVFSLINFLAIASNWVSCVAYCEDSTSTSFFVDIITLGVFFTVTQVVTDLYQTQKLGMHNLLIVVGIMYIVIHVLFVIWNIYVLNKSKVSKQLINKTNFYNLISMLINVIFVTVSFFDDILAFCIFMCGFAFWIFLITYFIREVKKDTCNQ